MFLGVGILVRGGGRIAALDEAVELVRHVRQRFSPVSKRAVVTGARQTARVRTVIAAALLAWRKQMVNHVAEVRVATSHLRQSVKNRQPQTSSSNLVNHAKQTHLR